MAFSFHKSMMRYSERLLEPSVALGDVRLQYHSCVISRACNEGNVVGIIKKEAPPIVRATIVEVVPGIVAVEIKPVGEQLRHVEKRLDIHYANLKGVTKEIDEIHTEVRAIQKHLGIDRKIAA